jgi:hypothetical protein
LYGRQLLLGTIASYWHTLSLAARRSVRGRLSELVEPLLAVPGPPHAPISSYCRDLDIWCVLLVPLLARCKFLYAPPITLSSRPRTPQSCSVTPALAAWCSWPVASTTKVPNLGQSPSVCLTPNKEACKSSDVRYDPPTTYTAGKILLDMRIGTTHQLKPPLEYR